ncbi:MAG TPA: PAS domain-containing sensor histidine kinase [Armatimonadota bacterium]|jgi:hypothetical protein
MPAETCRLTTNFAPAERATPEAVQAQRDQFLADPIAPLLLEAMPDPVMVLNGQRQIVAGNGPLLQLLGVSDVEAIVGSRPGEATGCVHADDCAGGCGTSEYCFACGAVEAILSCLETQASVRRECRLRTAGEQEGGARDLEMQASYLPAGDTEFVVLAVRDLSAEKRRQVLERVFFHDVLNTAMSIRAVAELASADNKSGKSLLDFQQDLRHLSRQMVDEIVAQRELVMAERGELRAHPSPVSVPALLESLVQMLHGEAHAAEVTVRVESAPEVEMVTDAALLKRVLGNLLRNAVEATGAGGVVTLAAEDHGDRVAFLVHNAAVLSPEVRAQIFQRSFSTKPGAGRGVGTHSVKLLTERYLGGEVSFTSDAAGGTTFTVILPRSLG